MSVVIHLCLLSLMLLVASFPSIQILSIDILSSPALPLARHLQGLVSFRFPGSQQALCILHFKYGTPSQPIQYCRATTSLVL